MFNNTEDTTNQVLRLLGDNGYMRRERLRPINRHTSIYFAPAIADLQKHVDARIHGEENKVAQKIEGFNLNVFMTVPFLGLVMALALTVASGVMFPGMVVLVCCPLIYLIIVGLYKKRWEKLLQNRVGTVKEEGHMVLKNAEERYRDLEIFTQFPAIEPSAPPLQENEYILNGYVYERPLPSAPPLEDGYDGLVCCI